MSQSTTFSPAASCADWNPVQSCAAPLMHGAALAYMHAHVPCRSSHAGHTLDPAEIGMESPARLHELVSHMPKLDRGAGTARALAAASLPGWSSGYVHLARLVISDSTSLTELAARPWRRRSFTDVSSHCSTVWDVSNRYASNVAERCQALLIVLSTLSFLQLLLAEANIF